MPPLPNQSNESGLPFLFPLPTTGSAGEHLLPGIDQDFHRNHPHPQFSLIELGALGGPSGKPIRLRSSLGKSNGFLHADNFISSMFSCSYCLNLAAESMGTEGQLCSVAKNQHALLKRRVKRNARMKWDSRTKMGIADLLSHPCGFLLAKEPAKLTDGLSEGPETWWLVQWAKGVGVCVSLSIDSPRSWWLSF